MIDFISRYMSTVRALRLLVSAIHTVPFAEPKSSTVADLLGRRRSRVFSAKVEVGASVDALP